MCMCTVNAGGCVINLLVQGWASTSSLLCLVTGNDANTDNSPVPTSPIYKCTPVSAMGDGRREMKNLGYSHTFPTNRPDRESNPGRQCDKPGCYHQTTDKFWVIRITIKRKCITLGRSWLSQRPLSRTTCHGIINNLSWNHQQPVMESSNYCLLTEEPFILPNFIHNQMLKGDGQTPGRIRINHFGSTHQEEH